MADKQTTQRDLHLGDGGQVPEDLARLAVEVIVAADPWYAVGLLTGSLGRLLRTKFPQERHEQMIARIAEHVALSASGADLLEEARNAWVRLPCG